MSWIVYGGIPQRGLALRSWPAYGIPGWHEPEKDGGGGYPYHDYEGVEKIKRYQEEFEIVEILTILARSGVFN